MNLAIILKKDNKRIFSDYFIKREIKYINGKELNIYSVSGETPAIIKRLIKKLKRDNIKKLAADGSFSSCNFCEFEVITADKVFKKNIVKIIKKITKTLGMEKGNLKLGLMGENISLAQFIPLGRELKTIYLYSAIRDEDLFYKKTGIPVITKPFPEENECEILIVDNNFKGIMPKTVKYIIETGKTDLKDSRCICDIRFENCRNSLFPGIKNCVVNDILGEQSSIVGFVKKTLDTTV